MIAPAGPHVLFEKLGRHALEYPLSKSNHQIANKDLLKCYCSPMYLPVAPAVPGNPLRPLAPACPVLPGLPVDPC